MREIDREVDVFYHDIISSAVVGHYFVFFCGATRANLTADRQKGGEERRRSDKYDK